MALPHSEESERAVLGGVMLDPSILPMTSGRLVSEDFYSERHKLLYQAMLDLAAEQREPDLRTLQARLERAGTLEQIGGLAYLTGLDLDLPDIGRIGAYVEIVRERSTSRRLIQDVEIATRACRESGAAAAVSILGPAVDRALRALEPVDVVRGVNVRDFLMEALPPRPVLIHGLAHDRDGLGLHGWRGLGKSLLLTHLSVNAAYGRDFLRWLIPEPVGVLYVDGEMPQQELQQRFAAAMLCDGIPDSDPPVPLILLAADRFPAGLPSLAVKAGQSVVERALEKNPGVKLVVLDSVSTLCADPGATDSNSEESWTNSVGPWIHSLRRNGYTVLVVYHDGKNGKDRGTSAREDTMSQIVQITRPAGYRNGEGCRLKISLTKARGFFGPDAEDFETRLQDDAHGRPVWTWEAVEDAQRHATGNNRQEVKERLKAGSLTEHEALELGIPRSTYFRWKKEIDPCRKESQVSPL